MHPPNKTLQFILGTAGIFISYITIAIFAQKLYSTRYPSTIKFRKDGSPFQHRFSHPTFVVLMSTLFCAVFGFARSWVTKERRNPIASQESILSGLFYAINTTSTNFALLYLSYPTQVISSSVRYLLVVIVGTYCSRLTIKSDLKIPRHKIYVALVITFGVVLFNVTKLNSKFNANKAQGGMFFDEWKGYMFVMSSMVADAFFCDTQAYIKSTYHPTMNHMFTSTNLCAFIISLLYSCLTHSFLPGLRFITSHPSCLIPLLTVCTLQVTGQLSIYFIISNFKQHVFPLISTTRKIFTIACSIIVFNHKLSGYQWVALGVIGVGMAVEVWEEVLGKKGVGLLEFSLVEIEMEGEKVGERKQAPRVQGDKKVLMIANK